MPRFSLSVPLGTLTRSSASSETRMSAPPRHIGFTPFLAVRAKGVLGRVVFAVTLVLLATLASAGEPGAGRAKAASCAVCHGKDGIATRPDAPHIAGQNDLYLRGQLEAYRSGQRAHPVMNVVARALSDEDIDDLAAWYSSIKLIVELPE